MVLSANLRAQEGVEKPTQHFQSAASFALTSHPFSNLLRHDLVTFESSTLMNFGDFSQLTMIEPDPPAVSANIQSDTTHMGPVHGFSTARASSGLTRNLVGVMDRTAPGWRQPLLQIRRRVKLFQFSGIKPDPKTIWACVHLQTALTIFQ